MSNIILTGNIGMAKKDQKNGYGFDVIRGQLQVIQEGYDVDLWEPVTINEKGEVFKIKPVSEPLTFERIRRECVAGETVLNNASGIKYLFCGWDHLGRILTQYLKDDGFCPKPQPYSEAEIKNWRIVGKHQGEEQ